MQCVQCEVSVAHAARCVHAVCSLQCARCAVQRLHMQCAQCKVQLVQWSEHAVCAV